MNEHHYQRIDKGQPRTRRSVPRRRNPATNAVQAIPEGLQAHEVLDRYLTEETTSQIAKSYGVARKSLVAWLRETVPQEWHRVQVLRALCRKEDSDEGLEQASDPLSLARAREMLKSAQWELERLDSANYGDKREVTVLQADLGDRLRRARERVIPGEATHEIVPTLPSESSGDK